MPKPHFWVRHLDGPRQQRILRFTESAAKMNAMCRSLKSGGYFIVENEDGQPLQIWHNGHRISMGPILTSSELLTPSRS